MEEFIISTQAGVKLCQMPEVSRIAANLFGPHVTVRPAPLHLGVRELYQPIGGLPWVAFCRTHQEIFRPTRTAREAHWLARMVRTRDCWVCQLRQGVNVIREQHRQLGAVLLVKTYLGIQRDWLGHVTHVRDLRTHPTKDIQAMSRSRYLITLEILGPRAEAEPRHRAVYDAYANVQLVRPPQKEAL